MEEMETKGRKNPKPNEYAENYRHVDPYDTYSSQGILVSYLDEYNCWPALEPVLTPYLTFKKISWKSNSNITGGYEKSGEREIGAKFLPFDDRAFQFDPIPLNLYLKPAVNIYFIYTEDKNLYNKEIKEKVKNWIQLKTSKNLEYLIVHVSSAKAQSILQRSIFDRLKSDFPKERCCQLRLMDESKESKQLWNEFIDKLKQYFVINFGQVVSQYEEEIRKEDSQRLNKGWNFLKFFLLKEGLAFTYEASGLYQEAYRQYYELEVLFAESTSGSKVNFFGGTTSGDDYTDLLSTTVKPYRALIYDQAISEFDFKQYLFARQMKLLLALSRAEQVAEIGTTFIQKISKDLQNQKLAPYFHERWVYSACTNMARVCEEAGPNADVHFYLGDLYFHARTKLDILGEAFHLLSRKAPKLFPCEPYSVEKRSAINLPPFTKPVPQITVSNPELSQAFQSITDFDLLYLAISQKAVRSYKHSRRNRNSQFVNGQIASLYFKRANFEKAEGLLKNLAVLYTSEGWYDLVYSITAQLAECQRQIRNSSDYIETCLCLLSPKLLISKEEKEFYLSELIDVSRNYLKTSVEKTMPNLVEAKVTFTGVHFSLGSSINLKCELNSHFPKELFVDTIAIVLSSPDLKKEIIIEKSQQTIPCGSNEIAFFGEVTATGSFKLERLIFKLGQLQLQQKFELSGNDKKTERASIYVSPSTCSLDINYIQPRLSF